MCAAAKKIVKVVTARFFYFASFLMWLSALALVLEFSAFLISSRIEKTNPRILAYKQQQFYSEKNLSVKTAEAATLYPDLIGGWEKEKASAATAQAKIKAETRWFVVTSFDSDARKIQRLAFPDMSSNEKERYARLNGEKVLLVDGRFRLYAFYGSEKYALKGVQKQLFYVLLRKTGLLNDLCDAINEALETQQLQERLLYLPDKAAPQVLYHLSILPRPNDGRAYVFINSNPEALYAPPVAQPAKDSRWQVPFYCYKKNVCHVENELVFQTNSLGFRGAEVSVPKPQGVFRILCIGGSTTDEMGEEALTYPAKLELLMREAFPDSLIEVVNAGTPGITSKDHLLRLPEYLQLEPDMVIAHLGVNDTLNIYSNPVTNAPARISHFIRLFMPSLLAPSSTRFKNILQEDMGFNLMLLAEQFQNAGTAIVFASMPAPALHLLNKEQRQYFNYQGKQAWDHPAFSLARYCAYLQISNTLLRNLAQQAHAIYAPLAERMAPAVNVYSDFCHMNQAGINTKAQLIFDSIGPVVAARIGS